MTEQERRRATRYNMCVPTGVKTPARERIGIIRNTSATGALILSESRFAVGEEVTLEIQAGGNRSEVVEVRAKVLRQDAAPEGLWRCRLAMVFTPPRPDLVPLFQRLETKPKPEQRG
jgi:PilZ domain